jgi:hypothetical protein
MANQGAGLIFIGAEILANWVCCSCSIPWIKPLPAFAIVEEGSLIFNFAIDCKVHFSLKIQRKSNLKTTSANCKRPETTRHALLRRRVRPRRQAAVRTVPVSGVHAEALERPSAAALRRRELTHAVHGKWAALGGVDPPAGAPPVVRHWPLERRTSPAMPRPLHTCVSHWRDLTSPKPTSSVYKNLPRPLLACTRTRHRAPPSAIGAAGANLPPVDTLTPTGP